MFNKAEEYGKFLKNECANCPFYVRWDDESSDKPLCKIEERIAWAMYTGNRSEDFPYECLGLEWSKKDKSFHYVCKKKPKSLGEIA